MKKNRLIATYTHLLLILGISLMFSGCTLCFQNISTHGTATDLVDDNQSASPTIDTQADISFLPKVPKIPYMNGPVGSK